MEKDKIVFSSVKDKNLGFCYSETTLNATEKTHLMLLDLFFRPQEILDDFIFNEIFPEKPDYQDNHKMIPLTRNYMPWNGWVFRGQSNSSWSLSTSFERLCLNKPLGKDLYEIEQGIIRNFKRNIFALRPELSYIKDDDFYECLSWMQHFGCATRFLDVTYSFFIALYFAIVNSNVNSEEEEKNGKTNICSIWCFNRMWIEWKYKRFLPPDIEELYNKYDKYGKDPHIQEAVLKYVYLLKSQKKDFKNTFLSVINMSPFYQNSRTIKQKGMFLLPTNIYKPFEENLFNMVEDETEAKRILKINIEYNNETLVFLQKLLDDMNVNSAVLFEGMEGFCSSINLKTRIPNDSLTISPNAGAKYII